MTETVAAKATRLVTSGSVSWTHAGAIVQGDTHDYLVQRRGARWTCSCPWGRTGNAIPCAHVFASALTAPVGLVPAPEPAPQDDVDPFQRF